MTRAESARVNGTLSHGPVTPEGKARSSHNAVTHGLNSNDVVIAGESQEEFDALLAEYVRQHRPANDVERSLVFELAAARWRIRRIVGLESAAFDEELNRVMNDEENPVEEPNRALTIAMDRLAGGKALANIHRYETRLHRQYDKALDELLERQEFRRQNPMQNEPEPALAEADPATLRRVCEDILRETNPGASARAFLTACIAEVAKFENEPERAKSAAA
jgi:hypothetical protein